MKNIISIVAVLITLFSLGCAQYVNPIDMHPIGKSYYHTINVRDMELPLPPGEWEVVGSSFHQRGNYVQIILEQDIDNKPVSIISIVRDSVANSSKGYRSPIKEIKKDKIIFLSSIDTQSDASHDIWYIDHMTYKPPGQMASEANRAAYRHVIENKLIFPGNFIKIKHFFTGAVIKKKCLHYTIYVNPEAFGIAPPSTPEWESSDWNILKINNYPQKLEFIEKIKKENEDLHKQLRVAFGR